ncbi:hypothetical protein [Spirosoma pomorum]
MHSSEQGSGTSPNPCSSAILDVWITESNLFRANYQTLSGYLTRRTKPIPSLPARDLPPSLASALGQLLDRMESELVSLLRDLDSAGPNAHPVNSQLATHTRRLHQLNQQAQLLINQLAGLN